MKKKQNFIYYNIKKSGVCLNNLVFGEWGLQSKKFFLLSKFQLESIIYIFKKFLKNLEIYWIRIVLNKFISYKSIDSRMGSGKGNNKFLVAIIRKKKILFELSNLQKKKVFFIFHKISFKLSKPTIIIKKF